MFLLHIVVPICLALRGTTYVGLLPAYKYISYANVAIYGEGIISVDLTVNEYQMQSCGEGRRGEEGWVCS